MANILKIRAHHLLCMQGFQGYGYSKDFVDNMARVIENIRLRPNSQIELIAECDVICSACPYNGEGVCQKEEDAGQRVRNRDLVILRRLELEVGAIVRAKDIFSVTNSKLKDSPDIQDICGDCDWKEKCLWFTSRGQRNLSWLF